jgi:acyl carrier protein
VADEVFLRKNFAAWKSGEIFEGIETPMTAWFKKNSRLIDNHTTPFDREAAAQKLRSFVASKSKLVQAADIGFDMKLFSSGLLDSLAFIELVLFVEKEFHVKLSDVTDVNMDCLDSIEQIINPVVRASAK